MRNQDLTVRNFLMFKLLKSCAQMDIMVVFRHYVRFLLL